MSTRAMNISKSSSRREARSAGRPFLLVLFGVFAMLALGALLVGLQGYRLIVSEQDAVDEERLAYGSLVNSVKAFDSVNAFTVGEYEGNDLLLMRQPATSGEYVMMLYVHEGFLVQQYALTPDVLPAPEAAHALFATALFHVEFTNGLLMLRTDAGSADVHLMTAQPELTSEMNRRSQAAEAGEA